MKPSFFVIGAPKCGTTSLHQYLRQHPQVFLPDVKNPNYFAFGGRAPDFQGPGDAADTNDYRLSGWDDYLALYSRAVPGAACGDLSPLYLYVSGVAQRLAEACPDARIMAILRNPVDRAHSNYRMMLREGREPSATFAAALRQEELGRRTRWAPIWHYAERGFYGRQLAPWFAIFPREHVRVWLDEDLARDPAEMMADVFGWLGVDPGFTGQFSERHNQGGLPRSRQLAAFLGAPHPLKRWYAPLTPGWLRKGLNAWVRRANLRVDVSPRVDPAVRSALIERYRPDVQALESLIGRDLRHWLA